MPGLEKDGGGGKQILGSAGASAMGRSPSLTQRAVVMWPPADWTCGVCGHLWQAMLYTGYKPGLLVLTTYFILEN